MSKHCLSPVRHLLHVRGEAIPPTVSRSTLSIAIIAISDLEPPLFYYERLYYC